LEWPPISAAGEENLVNSVRGGDQAYTKALRPVLFFKGKK